MGCTVSNIKLEAKNRQQQHQADIQQIDLQQVYDDAIILCKQDRYEEANEKFQVVNQYYPTFPYIQMNLKQCQNLIKAKLIYDEGQRLLNRGQMLQALEKFENIEQSLQPNFKDVKQQIITCREYILRGIQSTSAEQQQLIQKNQDYILQFLKLLMDKQEQKRLVESNFEQLRNSTYQAQMTNNQYQFSSSYVPLQQNHSLTIVNRPKQRQKLPPINVNGSGTDLFNKVPIYFVCTKTPKCKEWKQNSQIKHSQCGTTAYFHADGKISCQKNCETNTIKNALFSCKANQVFKDDQKLNQQNNEQISDMRLLADFIEDCLKQDNHDETDQNEFRRQAGIGALMLFI